MEIDQKLPSVGRGQQILDIQMVFRLLAVGIIPLLPGLTEFPRRVIEAIPVVYFPVGQVLFAVRGLQCEDMDFVLSTASEKSAFFQLASGLISVGVDFLHAEVAGGVRLLRLFYRRRFRS